MSGEKEALLCRCEKVSHSDVRNLLNSNPKICPQGIKDSCGAATRCGSCEEDLIDFIANEKPSVKITKDWRITERKTIRILHLYTSLVASLFLIFFAFTGFVMNHSESFGLDDVRLHNSTEVLPNDLLQLAGQTDLIDKMRQLGARGKIVDLSRDRESATISFKSAGSSFDAEVDLTSGVASIVIEESGLMAALSEIHRSKSSDGESSFFIDIMAFLMIFVSFSGLLLFFRSGGKKALAALLTFLCAAVGIVTVFIYLI